MLHWALFEMRVLVVTCVFPPEPVVSAQTSAQIAEELVQRGHRVTVLASFPSRPGGRLYPGFARQLFRREKDTAGFELIRCFAIPSSESRLLSRFLENLSFGLTCAAALLTVRRIDIIYANTWPIVATGLVALVARLRKIPLVISVQDVYPESMVSQGRIKPDALIARGIRWIDTLIVRACKAVIVISDSFSTIYRRDRGVSPNRVHVVPNWIKSDSVQPNNEPAGKFRKSLCVPQDAFVVAFGGNVGVAAGVETVVESFCYLKANKNLYLLIAGDGSNLGACRALAKSLGIERIRFHTPWLTEETSPVLGAADLLVLPTRGSQSLASVPSKLMSYMLAARPVMALAWPKTDLANMVEQSGCGWVIEPEQPVRLASKINDVLAIGTAERMRYGQAGRNFALKHLTREACLPTVIHLLEEAAI